MMPHTYDSWAKEFLQLPWQLQDGEEHDSLISLYNDASVIMDGYFTQDDHIDWYAPVRVMQMVDTFTQLPVIAKKAAVANAMAIVRHGDYQDLGERFCLALAYSGVMPHEAIEYLMDVIDGRYSEALAAVPNGHLIKQRDANRSVGLEVAQHVKNGTLTKTVSALGI